MIAFITVVSPWGPALFSATSSFASNHFLDHSPQLEAPLAPPEVYGRLCLAQPDATPPNPLGCNGYLPISNVSVGLSSWNDFPSSAPIAWPHNPATIPVVARSTTATDGSFLLNSTGDVGQFVLWAPNASDRIGGAFDTIGLNNSSRFADLIAYPYAPQGNVSFVLPHFTPLNPYVFNANCLGCGAFHWGNGGTQVPNLAWTQDGAIYVNSTNQLVFYSFANRTVRDIAPWWPLYDNVMEYAGIENTEWLTTDGAWVYEFGCISSCVHTSTIAFYAVNVSTGRTFSWNFTGVTDYDLLVNAQINMIGLDGNDSIAALILGNGTVLGWNLWTDTQWNMGKLAYFEANNVEWVPPLDSYINVQAEGSVRDMVSQWELHGPAAQPYLAQAGSLKYWNGNTAINGENWGAYNVTSHQFVVTSAYNFTVFGTFVFGCHWSAANRTFELSTLLRSYLSASYAAPFGESVESSEHRAAVMASGELNAMQGIDTFYNNTIHADPFTGMYQDTNVTVGYDTWATEQPAGYWYTTSSNVFPEGLFYNASYGIPSYSTDCRTPTPCTIAAGGGIPVGTVNWVWPLGSPMFPVPRSAPLAQPLPPGQVTNVTYQFANGTMNLSWDPPSTGQYPVVNYSVEWTSGTSSSHWVSLYPQNRTVELIGLPVQGALNLSIYATNLHGWGPAYSFELSLPQNETFPVVFSESGLPVGAAWSVQVVGVNYPANGTIDTFSVFNGSYPFKVDPPANYTALPSSGTLSVQGAPVSDNVTFQHFLPHEYPVTVQAAGLPTNSTWGVSIDGTSLHGNGTSFLLQLANGSYPYTVITPSGYRAQPSSGTLLVSGSSAFLNVTFSVGPAPLYTVTFSESGLPSGTDWNVSLQGQSQTGNLSVIDFKMPNGTYSYSVSPLRGYLVNVSQGTLTVNGAAPATVPLFFEAIPQLSGVTISPTSEVLRPGATVSFTASPTCRTGTCPSNVTYAWVLGAHIGTLSSNIGNPVEFVAGNVTGSGNLAVEASLWGGMVAAIVNLSVVPNASQVVSVSVPVSAVSLDTGSSVLLNASIACSPGKCPTGIPFTWRLNNSLGVLKGAGSAVDFIPGDRAGTTLVTVSVPANGRNLTANVSITILQVLPAPRLSVRLSPTSENLTPGQVLVLEASPTCVPSPCVSVIAYSWSLNASLGGLNSTHGPSVTFTAGQLAGAVAVMVQARYQTASAVNQSSFLVVVPPVYTPPPPARTGLFGAPPAGSNGLLFAGVALVVLVGAVGFHRRLRALSSRRDRFRRKAR